MADLADYAIQLDYFLTLSGTVTADSGWVYVNGTITVDAGQYPYFRATSFDAETGVEYPGRVFFPYERPWLFARLPNSPFGARIIYADDPDAPNAMTELDGDNVGVFRDADFPQVGKYLYSQARSKYIVQTGGQEGPRAPGDTFNPPMTYDVVWDLGTNGIRRQYEYSTYRPGFVLNPVPLAEPKWVPAPIFPIVWDASNFDIQVISRGNYTFLALGNEVSPGMVIDLDMRWWNGPGYRCGDRQLVQVD